MHLSHVEIYSATFLSPPDANLAVRVVRNRPDPLSPPQHSLMCIPRVEGPSQGCSDTKPSLISTWLVWLPHTAALNSAWANLSQGEGNQIFLSNTSSLLHKDTLQGVAAWWVCPGNRHQACPRRKDLSTGESSTQAVPSLPQVGKARGCAWSQCAQVWPRREMWKRERFGEMAQEGHYPRGSPTLGTGAPPSPTGVTWPQKGSQWSGWSLWGGFSWAACVCTAESALGFCFTSPRGLCPL